MKKLSLIFALILISLGSNCFAEQCYVYIKTCEELRVDEEEKAHFVKGDIVGIWSYTPQYKPTRAELDRYKILIIDLTEAEKQKLLEEEGKTVDGVYEMTKPRKNTIDINKIKNYKQEQEIDKKTILNNISVKSQ